MFASTTSVAEMMEAVDYAGLHDMPLRRALSMQSDLFA